MNCSSELSAEQELRVEVGEGGDVAGVTVTLREGTCECFGTELAPRQPYAFGPGAKFALFSWHGCTLVLSGSPFRSYVAEKTPMASYLLLHEKLEETRALAAKNASIPGPVVVVAGPTDSGKSTLSRTLLAWAVRAGHRPVFVDVDVGQGALSVPGTLAAVVVDRVPPVADGVAGLRSAPVALQFGHVSLDRNPALYRALVESVDALVAAKMDADPVARRSGTVVNTCGWVEGLGYELLLHVVKAMRADVVVVMDNERLFHFLRSDLRDRPEIAVEMLAKSGGVVARNSEFRGKSRLRRIREYFYGPAGDLCPHSTVLNFADVRIFRLGGTPAAPASTLPIGQAPQFDPLCAMEVIPSFELSHSLIAVLHCDDPAEILHANVAGFIYVSKVDMEKKTLTALAPCPGPLPSKILVVGSIKWLE